MNIILVILNSLALFISVVALLRTIKKDKIQQTKIIKVRIMVHSVLDKEIWTKKMEIEVINWSRKKLFLDRIRIEFSFQSKPDEESKSFGFPIQVFSEPEEIINLKRLNKNDFMPLPYNSIDEIENGELLIQAFISDSMGNNYVSEIYSFSELHEENEMNELFLKN
jgi:hypothetical protein